MLKICSAKTPGALLWLGFFIVALTSVGHALAHGVASGDEAYLARNTGMQVWPFMYLGAKHMVTGYDHLLYLAGVIYFLQKPLDVFKFVSLFAIGHSITLLIGVLLSINVNPFFIDAIIGLSVCYKALENLGTNKLIDARLAVFGFGLVHGFGLSSKLQDISLSADGLIANMLFFNVGVEIGQIIALTFLLLGLNYLRQLKQFQAVAIYSNVLIFGAGIVLFGMQAVGFFTQ